MKIKMITRAVFAGALTLAATTNAFAIKAATDWVVTMPTKRFAPSMKASPKAQAYSNKGGANLRSNSIYDRWGNLKNKDAKNAASPKSKTQNKRLNSR
jgi:hypothetical protein